MNLTELRELAARIQAFEFEHCFTLHPDGSITEPTGVWAPEVYHDDTHDVVISGMHGTDWSAITGLTGQYGYSGACMHPSEFIGVGVVRTMLELCDDEPVTFALVVVTDPDDDTDDNLVGWVITYLNNPVTTQ